MPAQNRPPGNTRSAVLILPNGVEHHGLLRFTDSPQVAVNVPPRLVNVLLVLADKQERNRGSVDGTWMNYARISEAFRTVLKRYEISRTAAQRYVAALMRLVEETFALHGADHVPALIEKQSGMGVRLACTLVVDDITKHDAEESAAE